MGSIDPVVDCRGRVDDLMRYARRDGVVLVVIVNETVSTGNVVTTTPTTTMGRSVRLGYDINVIMIILYARGEMQRERMWSRQTFPPPPSPRLTPAARSTRREIYQPPTGFLFFFQLSLPRQQFYANREKDV